MMRRYGVKQHDNRDCGAACLATICKYYGLNIPLVKVREKLRVDKNGSSLYALARVAKAYGLKADVLKGTYEELNEGVKNGEINLPCIVHWAENDYGHYIVVKKFKGDRIKIFDPAKGDCTLKKEKFQNKWSGYIVSFSKDKEYREEDLTNKFYLKYWRIFISQRKLMVGILFLSLILSGVTIISALAYERIINNFILGDVVSNINYEGANIFIANAIKSLNVILSQFHYFFIALLIILSIQMFLNILKGHFVAKISKKVNEKLLSKFFEKIFHLPMSFFRDRETGEIISRFSDIGEIRSLIAEGGVTIIINLFMVLVGGIILFRISVGMFFIVIVILLIYMIIVMVYKNPINRVKLNIFEQNSKLISKLKESIDNITSIKNTCTEKKKENELKHLSEKVLSYAYKGEIISRSQNALLNNIERIGIICTMWFGSYLVIKGNLTLGDLFVFESLIGFFLSPFQQLIVMQIDLQGAFIAMERLNDVLEVNTEDDICIGTRIPSFCDSDIVYDGVCFGYNYDNLVLKDINIKFRHGKKYALIGESGCGKSTIMNLLVQYYRCEKGIIRIGECNIENISLKYLRKKIKYISAEALLFSGSIWDNLMIAKSESILDEEIDQILNGCSLLEVFNNLPNGIYTKISEGGVELSCGQRQRIILAQVLLSRPEILILDEATSHLDEDCEKKVFNFVLDYCKDMTCIFILHNLSLVSLCDEVIVMNHGKIVETVSNRFP